MNSKTNISISAALEWRRMADSPKNKETTNIAIQMVTDNIIERLRASKPVNFQDEIDKIIMDTDGDPAVRDILLMQIQGIAYHQGDVSFMDIDRYIDKKIAASSPQL